MSNSKKLTAQVRRYDRRYDRVQKANEKFAALDEFVKYRIWNMVLTSSGVGASLGVLFGTGWGHLGNAAFGALVGFFAAILVIPLTMLASMCVLRVVPEMLLEKTARPSQAEFLLYRLEQYRNNPALDWLAADIDAAMPAAQRVAKTGIALRKADTDVVSIVASEQALRPCLDSLQHLTHRCGVEAEKAEKVLVAVSKKDAPCYLHISDAEELSRVVAVADAVATFRAETMARQEQPSI